MALAKIKVQTIYVNGEKIYNKYKSVNYDLTQDKYFKEGFPNMKERKKHIARFETFIPELHKQITDRYPGVKILSKYYNFRAWCYSHKKLHQLFVTAIKMNGSDYAHLCRIRIVRIRYRRNVNLRNIKAVWVLDPRVNPNKINLVFNDKIREIRI